MFYHFKPWCAKVAGDCPSLFSLLFLKTSLTSTCRCTNWKLHVTRRPVKVYSSYVKYIKSIFWVHLIWSFPVSLWSPIRSQCFPKIKPHDLLWSHICHLSIRTDNLVGKLQLWLVKVLWTAQESSWSPSLPSDSNDPSWNHVCAQPMSPHQS